MTHASGWRLPLQPSQRWRPGRFVAGAPDAAALVIAGKSVARFPSFKEEQFAEYYLIGSFLSLTIAAGAGMAVRAAIGLHPLVPVKI